MKKNVIFIAFLSLNFICNAQDNNLNAQDKNVAVLKSLLGESNLYSKEQHTDWILNSYSNVLNLTASQRQIVYQTILEAYNTACKLDIYSTAKNDTEIQCAEGIQIYALLNSKFKEILTPSQYQVLGTMNPRPENCFSLNKEYDYYLSSNSK